MVAMMGSLAAEKGWRKRPWTHEEDKLLGEYVSLHGEGRWNSVSKFTGLHRSGKSSRFRWVNYLRPGLKKDQLTPLEKETIIELHAVFGNKWSIIAKYLPGRTDNEIKNYWRTHFKKNEKSNDHTNKKLERKRAKIMKMKLLKQEQQVEEQPKECYIQRISSQDETNNNEIKSYETKENNGQHDHMGFMYPILEHQYSLSLMHQEYFSSNPWPGITTNDALWFSLWDFDVPQGFEECVNQLSKYAMSSQATSIGDGEVPMQDLSWRDPYIDTNLTPHV